MSKESRARARRVADLLARNRSDLVEECADYCEECGESFDVVAEFTIGIEDDIMGALDWLADVVSYDEMVRGLGYAVMAALGY